MSATLWEYYSRLGEDITKAASKGSRSRTQWQKNRARLRRQFMKSMGLDPLPPKCDLHVKEWGSIRGKEYRCTKLSYNILPDCRATACYYLPEETGKGELPAVLYLCGHKTIGTFGYQEHAVMWARRGYACLILDTIEQNDNPGEHHGLFYRERPDWISLGYTAAGGELWNSIRALDLLMTLPRVDRKRIGVTGTSGGGAHTFFLAIADERVCAAASSCGISTPEYALRHRHIYRHCDCMYYHNLFQIDPSVYGGLIAPRPILLGFASEDYLFSREEYRGLVKRIRQVYRLYGKEQACRLFEYRGGHGYKPESVRAVNEWFDRHLAGEKRRDLGIEGLDKPEARLSVFNGAPPEPHRLHLLPELLSPAGSIRLPASRSEWKDIVKDARKRVGDAVLRRGPLVRNEKMALQAVGSWLSSTRVLHKYRGVCGEMETWTEVLDAEKKTDTIVVGLTDKGERAQELLVDLECLARPCACAAIEGRARLLGADWSDRVEMLRAGALVGTTPTEMLIRDVLGILAALRGTKAFRGRKVLLFGRGDSGIACLYAGLLDEKISGVIVQDVPASHRDGAFMLDILRIMDVEHLVGLMAPRPVGITGSGRRIQPRWAQRAYERLGVTDRLVVEPLKPDMVFRRILEKSRGAR